MSEINYLSAVQYDNVDGLTDFTITFPYLRPEDVFVYLDGVPQASPAGWDFLDSSTIRLTAGVPVDATLVIRRLTKKDARLVNYFDGARLTERDLNLVTKQLLYLIQEINDSVVANEGGVPLPGGSPLDPDQIDQIITELLTRQTFQDLVALIPLVDINSELVIAQALENHDQWSLGRERDHVLKALKSVIEQQGASIGELQKIVETNDEALATNIEFVSANVDGNTSLITTIQNAYASADQALAEQITLVQAAVDGNVGSITTLQLAQADADSAIATLNTEVAARLRIDGLEGALATSSYINGITTSVDENGAEIATINSSLVDFGNTQSIHQATLNAHASQLSTEAEWRTILASRFGGTAADPDSLAAAMEDAWKTYADEESATAQAITSLQANNVPIFFGATAPNPTQEPHKSTYGGNFPLGSIWHKKEGTGNSYWKTRPFLWFPASSGTTPVGHDVSYPFTDQGVYKGAWLPATDQQLNTAMGARVDEVKDAMVGTGGSIANFRTSLQTAFGFGFNTIEEWMQSYIYPENPDTGEPGIMYNAWNVRINQYIDGVPVVAGVALGMQSDPKNPEAGAVSDFIVMADNFAVIKPPTGGDFIDGQLDVNSMVVPFYIDTATGLVAVNGDLFVKGTLKAYEGGLKDVAIGRATFGQLTAGLDLADPNGFRLNLLSSTENFWTSDSASPFPGGSNPQKFLIWAGSGTQNHNNALFYLDTDGNGFFGGQVSAENIGGDVSTAKIVSHFGPDVQAPASGWVQVGPDQVMPTSSTIRGRVPFCMLNVNMFGVGADEGRARLSMSYETAPSVWSSWQTVHEATCAQPTGTTLSLSGGLSFPVDYGVKVRVEIAAQNGDRPTSNGFSGIILALS